MNLKEYLLIFFVFVFVSIFSQDNLNEEKIFIDKFKKDSINFDFVKGLCLIDTVFNINNYRHNISQLDRFIADLPTKGKTDKREKRRVKKVYDLVHKKYFKKYNDKAFFNEIFTSGNYNCVSATALYVYVFDKLKIPYHIKELPTHVFLLAYPNSYKIHLETTIPGTYGFFIPKDTDITKIVDELIDVKLLTKSEVLRKGYKTTYQEYFYGKEHIKKVSLVGMQYYNKSIFEYNDKNVVVSFNNIIKSFSFYRNPYSKMILKSIIYEYIKQESLDSRDVIINLFNGIQLLKYKKDIDKLTVEYLLDKIVNSDKNDLSFIESLIAVFDEFEDEDLKKDCSLHLYKFLAVKHTNKRNYDESIKFTKKIITQNYEDKKAQEMMSFSVHRKMLLLPNIEESITSLESYLFGFDFLQNDKKIMTTYAVFYGQLAQKKFAYRDSEKGVIYFNKFENLLAEQKEKIQIRPDIIAGLYLKIGRFYYGKMNFTKAKEIFEKGLKLYPKHPDLKKMLKWAIEDMN